MATSRTEIANQALSLLGQSVIIDIDSPTDVDARKVKNVFDTALRTMIRAHEWNCLSARAELPRDVETPAFGFNYQYQLPTDCIRVKSVNADEYNDIGSDRFKIEGRKILTDDDSVDLSYIKYPETVSVLDASFIEAFVYLLASKLAIIFRQDEQLAQYFDQEYRNNKLSEARRIDGNERKIRPANISRNSTWLKARRISTNG